MIKLLAFSLFLSMVIRSCEGVGSITAAGIKAGIASGGGGGGGSSASWTAFNNTLFNLVTEMVSFSWKMRNDPICSVQFPGTCCWEGRAPMCSKDPAGNMGWMYIRNQSHSIGGEEFGDDCIWGGVKRLLCKPLAEGDPFTGNFLVSSRLELGMVTCTFEKAGRDTCGFTRCRIRGREFKIPIFMAMNRRQEVEERWVLKEKRVMQANTTEWMELTEEEKESARIKIRVLNDTEKTYCRSLYCPFIGMDPQGISEVVDINTSDGGLIPGYKRLATLSNYVLYMSSADPYQLDVVMKMGIPIIQCLINNSK